MGLGVWLFSENFIPPSKDIHKMVGVVPRVTVLDNLIDFVSAVRASLATVVVAIDAPFFIRGGAAFTAVLTLSVVHQSRPTFPRKMMESALIRRWTQLSAKIMTHVESHGGALAGDPVVYRSSLMGRKALGASWFLAQTR
jgi:hypothetical protein